MVKSHPDYKAQAVKLLEDNDQAVFTVPALGLYPHQWLWDSCFTAIGLRHIDVERSKAEILSLLKGQWSNGMIPNIVFNPAPRYRTDRQFWRSHVSPYSPSNVPTSGITQPPLLAEAVQRIGQKMSKPERRIWYQTVYPSLVRYHRWIYKERDPENIGLALCIHPYESGMDNSPTWIEELRNGYMPWWIKLMERAKLDFLVDIFRRDTKRIPPGQRMNNFEAFGYVVAVLRLRRKGYDIDKILKKPRLVVYDLAFNSMLIRANKILEEIAEDIKRELPSSLQEKIKLSYQALDELWDAHDQTYYSKSFRTNQLIKQSTSAHLLALYSGSISAERADQIISNIKNPAKFWLKFPLPSVPADSVYFDPVKYWQGPTWVNINWMVIDGLKRYGFDEITDELITKTIKMIEDGGFYEYFNPKNGNPEGAEGFSWTSALYLDLIKS